MDLLKILEIDPPYFIFITIIGIEGYYIQLPSSYITRDTNEITENEIYLPEVIINDFEEDLAKAIKPVFDMVWNAAGFSRSYGYDENGDRAKF